MKFAQATHVLALSRPSQSAPPTFSSSTDKLAIIQFWCTRCMFSNFKLVMFAHIEAPKYQSLQVDTYKHSGGSFTGTKKLLHITDY